MTTATIGTEQRRAWVAHRQRLTPDARSDDPVITTEALVALHATDPATVFLSLACRADELSVEDIEDALYTERVLDRVLGMRRTLFVVTPPMRPVIQAACTDKIATAENRKLVKMMEDSGLGGDDPDAHLADLKEQVLDALGDTQPALGRDIAAAVPGLREKLVAGSGRSRTEVGMTTLVLSRMTMDGTILRTRPTGSWLSSQFRYEVVGPSSEDPLTVADASAQLIGRYLDRFGPVTFDDCQWWTGWTKTQTRAALEDAQAVEVDLDSDEAFMTPDSLDLLADVPDAGEWVTFLPSLDPTTMGWKERHWYMAEGTETLFDRFGNAGPTVWSGGRVIGGWAQRPDATVVYRLVEDVGPDIETLADHEAARIEAWLDGSVVSPRFPVPLQKKLAG